MGCDGGTIPTRDELVKLKKKPEQKDADAVRLLKWAHCALSQQVSPSFKTPRSFISPQSERSELGAFYFCPGVLSGYCCVCESGYCCAWERGYCN